VWRGGCITRNSPVGMLCLRTVTNMPRNYQVLAGHNFRQIGHSIRLRDCVGRNSIFSRYRVDRITGLQNNDDVPSFAGTGGRLCGANGSSNFVGGGTRRGLRQRYRARIGNRVRRILTKSPSGDFIKDCTAFVT